MGFLLFIYLNKGMASHYLISHCTLMIKYDLKLSEFVTKMDLHPSLLKHNLYD